MYQPMDHRPDRCYRSQQGPRGFDPAQRTVRADPRFLQRGWVERSDTRQIVRAEEDGFRKGSTILRAVVACETYDLGNRKMMHRSPT